MSRLENILNYNKNPNLCKFCSGPILAPLDKVLRQTKVKIFCNHSCAASFNNQDVCHNINGLNGIINPKGKTKRKKSKFCLNCNQFLDKKWSRLYCNSRCCSDYKYKNSIIKWKDSGGVVKDTYGQVPGYIRKYLMTKHNYKCSLCEWGETNPKTGRTPLEVNHIDGNWRNSCEDNLELICPNCHSLTPNYKSLNKGNGRMYFRDRARRLNPS